MQGPIDVVCTLRDKRGGRGRVLPWLKEYAAQRKLHDVRLGQLSSAGRTVIDAGYLSTMRRAKVVVTCNPTGWEGDFRTDGRTESFRTDGQKIFRRTDGRKNFDGRTEKFPTDGRTDGRTSPKKK